MLSTEELLALIERFISDNGMAPARFGLIAIGDPSLVPNMRRGRKPGLSTYNRIITAINEYDGPKPVALVDRAS